MTIILGEKKLFKIGSCRYNLSADTICSRCVAWPIRSVANTFCLPILLVADTFCPHTFCRRYVFSPNALYLKYNSKQQLMALKLSEVHIILIH
jgi:hypothetical protein